MNSRMTKYYDETKKINSRYSKNEELYKEISKSELSNYDVKSNAAVIGENKKEIDIEKIKKILDTKYNVTPKRKSIRLEETEESEIEKEITKEYDINVILARAKEQKEDNYEEERLKKLRDTQFDILKNLDLSKKDDEELEAKEDNLKQLINTIAFNESHSNNDSTPLDILSDLKGSENTEVLEGLSKKVKDAEDNNEIKIESDNKDKQKTFTDINMINSFYTTSNALVKKDFEDINNQDGFDDECSKSIESNNTFIKIIIAIIVVVFIIGVTILIKTLYF